ncbi:FtsZ/tubulin family protein [Bacillus cihuensis]|uniref:cell division protein FtsZ n=1 Tax=Bacillus cihuensis TaxID=1208599 RepID=UPI000419A36A|nr:cell division protein FtsZ [Bacillus cihuensis]
MAKSFIKNKPAINMTIVGFGNAGSRMADEFAAFSSPDGSMLYNCLALNSNDGDLQALKNIPESSRVSLNLGGLGKNPLKAIEILKENEDANEKLKSFIHDKVRPTDDLVLFFAGLGGGTGTATIVKAITEFYEYNNKPLIKEELMKIQQSVGQDDFLNNRQKYIKQAFKAAESRFTKIGVIVTLPLRTDGPDVLYQVNEFSQEIWKTAKDASKGIAFVIFGDNQVFKDEFDKMPANERGKIDNYRDYGNKQISEIFHELNTATTGGGTSVLLDSQDFRRAIMEQRGSLVLSKVEAPMDQSTNADDITNLFKKSFKNSNLHQPIDVTEKLEDGSIVAKKVHHVGLLAILDEKKDLGNGGFLEDAQTHVHEILPVNGTVFSGFLKEKNDFKASIYTFYKVDGLPARLEQGLVNEYNEFMEKNKKRVYKDTTLQSIQRDDDDDFDLDLDLADFGMAPSTSDKNNSKKELETVPSLDDLLDNINFSDED